MNLKATLILYILISITKPIFSQELSMLDNVLAFTSQDDFIANNIYKVVSHNFSDDKSIVLSIEGDINSYEYSLALVSMLPAFNEFSNNKSITLKYSNLNDKNLSEAVLIEAIKTIYPQYLSEYLLTRAECLFGMNGLEVVKEMNLDIDKIEKFINSSSIKESIKHKFSTKSTENYKVTVNEIKFEMIPAFYLELDEPSLYKINPADNACSYLDCISRGLDIRIQLGFREGLLRKTIFAEREFIYNQKDLYVSLVTCTSPTKHSSLNKLKYLLNPSGSLLNMIEDIGYTGLAKYFDPKMYENICTRKPCHYYNVAILKAQEKRKNLVPEPSIIHSCSGNGLIALKPVGFQGKNSPYTYNWNSGQDKMAISNLNPGFYEVTIKDAVGRQEVREYEVKNIQHPYAIEIIKSKFDPSSGKYDIDIQIDCPNGTLNLTFPNILRAGLTTDKQKTFNIIKCESRTLHFSNVPPGQNELFLDISGSTDPVDLSDICEIIRMDFYLEEMN